MLILLCDIELNSMYYLYNITHKSICQYVNIIFVKIIKTLVEYNIKIW